MPLKNDLMTLFRLRYGSLLAFCLTVMGLGNKMIVLVLYNLQGRVYIDASFFTNN